MHIGKEIIQPCQIVAVLPAKEEGEGDRAVVILSDGRSLRASASAQSIKRRLTDDVPGLINRQTIDE